MTRVRRLDRAKRRFEQRAAGAAQDYVEGVMENTDWEQQATAAQGNYDAGVQKAVQQKRYSKGVRKAGQATYQQGVRVKGGGRFAEGVQQSGDKWETGFEPYRAAIEATSLPARGPRGGPANKQRMIANLDAIIAAADRIKGGGSTT